VQLDAQTYEDVAVALAIEERGRYLLQHHRGRQPLGA
jgi:hypothetical protein